MDPVTAAIALVTAIVQVHKATLDGMSPEQRVEYGRLVLEDLKRWNDFLNLFRPKVP